MFIRSTSIVLLIGVVALGAGAVERNRIWPASTQRREASRLSPPVPPQRPDIETTASISRPSVATPDAASSAAPARRPAAKAHDA